MYVNSFLYTTDIWPRSLWICFFFSVVQQPSSGLGHLVVEVPRSLTFRHTPGRAPLNETAAYRTHSKNKERTSMSSAGFETAIPAIKRLQTYILYRRMTCINSGFSSPCNPQKTCSSVHHEVWLQ